MANPVEPPPARRRRTPPSPPASICANVKTRALTSFVPWSSWYQVPFVRKTRPRRTGRRRTSRRRTTTACRRRWASCEITTTKTRSKNSSRKSIRRSGARSSNRAGGCQSRRNVERPLTRGIQRRPPVPVRCHERRSGHGEGPARDEHVPGRLHDRSRRGPGGADGARVARVDVRGPPAESERNCIEHSRTSAPRRRCRPTSASSDSEEPTFHAPVFVVTKPSADTIVKAGGTSYIFVTGGIDEALGRPSDAGRADASSAAAPISRVHLWWARSTSSACISILMILGGGGRSSTTDRRRASPAPIEVTDTPRVTHLTYEVAVTGNGHC